MAFGTILAQSDKIIYWNTALNSQFDQFFFKSTWSGLSFEVLHGILFGEIIFDHRRWPFYDPSLGVKISFKGLN